MYEVNYDDRTSCVNSYDSTWLEEVMLRVADHNLSAIVKFLVDISEGQ